jgi:hypothetical protein
MSLRASFLEKHFYFFMALLIPAVVVYGFSFTIGQNLLHPAIPRPRLLYLHAAIFSGWLVLLLVQSALVRTRNVAIHRTLGWFGLAYGIAIPGIGFPIAVVMTRFDARQLHIGNAIADMIVPFWDMVAFSTFFGLAMCWRKKPEFHRRLILIASCCLTAAAFGRFPANILPPIIFYAGVDALVLLGALRDWIVARRVHPVYVYGLPALILGQTFVMYTDVHASAWWVKVSHALTGV